MRKKGISQEFLKYLVQKKQTALDFIQNSSKNSNAVCLFDIEFRQENMKNTVSSNNHLNFSSRNSIRESDGIRNPDLKKQLTSPIKN